MVDQQFAAALLAVTTEIVVSGLARDVVLEGTRRMWFYTFAGDEVLVDAALLDRARTEVGVTVAQPQRATSAHIQSAPSGSTA
ncbi:hypothetical protein GCM10009795_028650 [Nocardioides hankookensis]